MSHLNNHIIAADIEEVIATSINWSQLRGKTVLVTGATGMLATYIVYTLSLLNKQLNYNIKIIALGRSEMRLQEKFGDLVESKRISLLVQDVCEQIDLGERVDYIFHLAGAASPSAITASPVDVIKANTQGTINVFEAAKKDKATVIFISTREVYGAVEQQVTRITEDTLGILNDLDSRSCYPGSKRIAETICKSYNDQYEIPFVILRVAHSYGPLMNLDNDGRVMADLISDVVNSRDITLLSSGEAIRAFCYITDTISGIFTALLDGTANQAYNLANENEPISILDLTKLLISLAPNKDLKITHKQPTDSELKGYAKFERVTLSTDKLESLGWNPAVQLRDGITRVLEYNK